MDASELEQDRKFSQSAVFTAVASDLPYIFISLFVKTQMGALIQHKQNTHQHEFCLVAFLSSEMIFGCATKQQLISEFGLFATTKTFSCRFDLFTDAAQG